MFSLFSLTLYILIAAIGLMMGFSNKQTLSNTQIIKLYPTKTWRWFIRTFIVGLGVILVLSFFTAKVLTETGIPDENSMRYHEWKSVMIFVLNLFFLALVILANIHSLAHKRISAGPYLLAIAFYAFFILIDAHYISDYFMVWQKSLRLFKGELPDFHSTAWIKCGLAAIVTAFNAVMIWWGLRK